MVRSVVVRGAGGLHRTLGHQGEGDKSGAFTLADVSTEATGLGGDFSTNLRPARLQSQEQDGPLPASLPLTQHALQARVPTVRTACSGAALSGRTEETVTFRGGVTKQPTRVLSQKVRKQGALVTPAPSPRCASQLCWAFTEIVGGRAHWLWQ